MAWDRFPSYSLVFCRSRRSFDVCRPLRVVAHILRPAYSVHVLLRSATLSGGCARCAPSLSHICHGHGSTFRNVCLQACSRQGCDDYHKFVQCLLAMNVFSFKIFEHPIIFLSKSSSILSFRGSRPIAGGCDHVAPSLVLCVRVDYVVLFRSATPCGWLRTSCARPLLCMCC